MAKDEIVAGQQITIELLEKMPYVDIIANLEVVDFKVL